MSILRKKKNIDQKRIEEFVNRKVSEDSDETYEKVGILENQIRKIQQSIYEIKNN